MKFFKMMMCAVLAMMVAGSCSPKKESSKVLVLYYSQTSNTKVLAQEIAKRLNADIEEIVPVEAYDQDYQATIDRCLKEREQGIKPEVKPLTSDFSKYDVVFIGYPIWFGTFAPPVGAFLDNVDLSDKKVVPFCTFGSGGLESSAKELAEKQPNAKIWPGYGVRAARMAAIPKEVDLFLKSTGFIEGSFSNPQISPSSTPLTLTKRLSLMRLLMAIQC